MKQVIFLLLLFFHASQIYAQVAFPLQVSANSRYLEDQNHVPFLYQADTGWTLYFELTKDEVKEYIQARKSQGFNTIQTMLMLPDRKNRDGIAPFRDNDDFSTINQSYFDFVEWVLSYAEKENMLIGIVPMWVSCCRDAWGGENRAMQNNGAEKVAQFGKYIGEKYAHHQNIIWILGGDNDPLMNRSEIDALAKAIKKEAPHQLHTYHAASTHSSLDVWENASWLDFSMVYTYFRGFNKAWIKTQPEVYEVSEKEYQRNKMPFILGESTYEGEHGDWGSALQARRQAWWCLLSGGCGHAYGSPLWAFPKNWREMLAYPGANSLKHLYSFFTALDWTQLIPDFEQKLIVNGYGTYEVNDWVTTAISRNKKLSISYLPSQRDITADLNALSGKKFKASWFNPTTGEYTIVEKIFKAGQIIELTPPAPNDWVLYIQAKR